MKGRRKKEQAHFVVNKHAAESDAHADQVDGGDWVLQYDERRTDDGDPLARIGDRVRQRGDERDQSEREERLHVVERAVEREQTQQMEHTHRRHRALCRRRAQRLHAHVQHMQRV